MLIDKSKLKGIISTTLGIMEEKQINSLEDLEKWVGHKFIPDSKRKDEYLEILERPSNQETTALTLSYISQNKAGIPLEIRINQQLGYSKIILKFNGSIGKYRPFMQDIYGNTMQERVLTTIDVQEVKNHLRDLF